MLVESFKYSVGPADKKGPQSEDLLHRVSLTWTPGSLRGRDDLNFERWKKLKRI